MFVEPKTGRVHDYCGRSHAISGGALAEKECGESPVACGARSGREGNGIPTGEESGAGTAQREDRGVTGPKADGADPPPTSFEEPLRPGADAARWSRDTNTCKAELEAERA